MTATAVTSAQADAGLWNTYGGIWTGNITYSVPAAGAVWDYGSSGNNEPADAQYGTFNGTQADSFGDVMELWDSYIARSINEVSDRGPGQIRVAFTDVTARSGNGVGAYAYGPNSGSQTPIAGDIWVDEKFKSADFARGSQAFELLIHESGHALGLKHPFESPTLPAGYDSTIYSVMSYTHPDSFYKWSGGGGSIMYSVQGTADFTPMVLDIQAVQGRYGADKSTNLGATTYAFIDSDLNGRQAIYDAGGTDTIDLSALSRGSNLDLRPGAYSDLAYYAVQDQIDDLSATYGEGFRNFITSTMTNPGQPAYEWTKNLGIAFSTQIENAVGTKLADSIIGNGASNILNGGAGNDTLNGGAGNDVLEGGLGADKLNGGSGSDTASYATAKAGVVASLANASINKGEAAGDTYTYIERLTGSAFADTLNGANGVNNTISGGAGNDTIKGYTGNDHMSGGAGNDTFAFNTALNATTNVDDIRDFKNESGDNDRFLLDDAFFAGIAGDPAKGGELLSGFFKDTKKGAIDINDHLIYVQSSGNLYYDGNGSDAGERVLFAKVTPDTALTYHDFFVN